MWILCICWGCIWYKSLITSSYSLVQLRASVKGGRHTGVDMLVELLTDDLTESLTNILNLNVLFQYFL